MFRTVPEYENILYNSENSPFAYQINKRITDRDHFKHAWHEEIEIKYIVSGAVNISVGGERIDAHAGDVVIINPCEHHINEMKVGDEAVCNILCVDLSRIFSKDILRGFKNISVIFNNLIRGDERVSRYAEELFASFERDDPLLSLGMFLVFFSTLTNHINHEKTGNAENRNHAAQEEMMDKVLAYIHEHYREKISIEEIASKCFVSKSQLFRVFKESTGDTPIHYINKFRINKAMSLITHSNLTIKEIARKVGFVEETYFCRCFKKCTGLSPTLYIEQQKRYSQVTGGDKL